MRLSAGLLGVALGQSGDDVADYTYDYQEKGLGYDSTYSAAPSYNFNTEYGYDQGSTYNSGYYGKADTTAYALSCWNSNSLRDMNHDNKFADVGAAENLIGSAAKAYNHQYGYENGSYNPLVKTGLTDYGAVVNVANYIDVGDAANSVTANDPKKWGYQSDNRDAKYHYGHFNEDDTANRYHGSQPANKYHGVQDDWRFSLRHSGCLWEVVNFSYKASTYSKQHTLAWAATSSNAVLHWVHIFNAHIYKEAKTSAATNTMTSIKVVMANPVYEGLGYLNFVSTYRDSATDPFLSTYAKSALYSNSMGTWTLSVPGSAEWRMLTTDLANAAGASNGLAISSFPHNELGKDFRFNIRTLHQWGHGRKEATHGTTANPADSYFFYAIDKIVVTFPQHVSAMHDCHRAAAACNAHQIHSVIVDENHIVAHPSASTVGRLTGAITEDCSSTYGVSTTLTTHNCATWCANSGVTCGKVLTIDNIMSTYDEFHLRQYGTLQEIWVQLQYAYTHSVAATPTGFDSPFPNMFFTAAEVSSVIATCPSADLKCAGYARANLVPYGGDTIVGNRWITDTSASDTVIFNGLSRGDAFWPLDHENA